MPLNLMSSGRGAARDLVVVYHCDQSAKSIQSDIANASGDAIVVNDTGPAFASYYATPMKLEQVKAWACREAGALAIRRVLIAGFSEGCQAPRAHLRAGARPDAVVACDGTHASNPPAAEHIEPWKAMAARARAGEAVFLASHTQIKPPTYLSTRETLELITGWHLTEKEASHKEGNLRVYSWPGADAAAHIEQCRLALPTMIAEAIDMMDAGPLTDRSPIVSSPHPPPLLSTADASDYGVQVLQVALEDLNRAPREDDGRNRSDFIWEMYQKPLGLRRDDPYCAAAVTSWMRRASERSGLQSPISGSAGAQTLMAQLKAAGRWVPAARLTPAMVRPGMVFVWNRPEAGPGKGHTGVAIEGVGAGSAGLVEANQDRLVEPITHQIYAVCQSERSLSDPKLFGAGYLGDMPAPPLSAA